ncbi:MAG: hypothetical protein IT449_14280 [Phycisphaerales bacterium]|nr:hypothetical protein [Phycisphaerales bacterium]
MTSEEATVATLDALNAMGVRYVLTGSLASSFHGIARSTKDADFVVELEGEEVAALSKRLPPGLRLDPQLSFETVTGTHRYIITNTSTAFKIELFLLSRDAHDQERLNRRKPITLHGHDAYVTTAEDVIITKSRWLGLQNRSKDHDDIVGVLSVRADTLDWPYIERWCREHGTWELLAAIRAAVPRLS